MASSNRLDFQASIDDWVRSTQERMNAVFRESTQRTISLAQSMIPVDTGFARASVRVSLAAMPQIEPSLHGAKDGSYQWDAGGTVAVFANAKIGDVIYVGWTASYVGALENGHSKQAPSGFVRLAALQWQSTVNAVIQDLKGRI